MPHLQIGLTTGSLCPALSVDLRVQYGMHRLSLDLGQSEFGNDDAHALVGSLQAVCSASSLVKRCPWWEA